MSGMFKPKKTEVDAPRQLTSPEQRKGYDYLLSQVNPGGQRYTGQLSEQPQQYESYLPGLVESYAHRQDTPLLTSAKSQLQKSVEGGYDPYNSEYYKAYRDQSNANLAEAQTKARQSAQVGGMLRSTGRLNTENKLIGETTRDQNSILAGMYEQERGRQIDAVPQAISLSQYEEDAPLRTARSLMDIGGYQTSQKQAGLDRLYQDYLQSTGQASNAAGILADPGTYNYYQPQYTTSISPLQALGSAVNPLYGDVLRSQGAEAPGMKMSDFVKLSALLI